MFDHILLCLLLPMCMISISFVNLNSNVFKAGVYDEGKCFVVLQMKPSIRWEVMGGTGCSELHSCLGLTQPRTEQRDGYRVQHLQSKGRLKTIACLITSS